MEIVQAAMYTSKMSDTYFPYSLRDVAYNQSLLTHSSTTQFTFTSFTGSPLRLENVFIFLQAGFPPSLSAGHKYGSRRTPARHFNILDQKHVLIELPDLLLKRVLAMEFYPVLSSYDPYAGSSSVYATILEIIQSKPRKITAETIAPTTTAYSKKTSIFQHLRVGAFRSSLQAG